MDTTEDMDYSEENSGRSSSECDRRKTRSDDTSPVPKRREKQVLKQKLIIKRSPKAGADGDTEFKAVSSVESLTISNTSSPLPDDVGSRSEDAGSRSQFGEEEEFMLTGDLTPHHIDTEDSFPSDGVKLTTAAIALERLASDESRSTDSDVTLSNLCSLCNCGEKSLLGQGDLTRYEATPGFNAFKRPLAKRKSGEFEDKVPADDKKPAALRRKRGAPKDGKGDKPPLKSPRRVYSQVDENGTPIAGVDELRTVGHPEDVEVCHVFEKGGATWAHHCCAAWSEGVIQSEDLSLLNVDKAVFNGLAQKCSYCQRFGATIACREPKCCKRYHYPCASGGGCFQDIKTLTLLCPEHADNATTVAPEEAMCVVCDSAGTICEQLFCTSCGQHYHGNCLDPPVEVNPIVRAGWQCPECKICQTCRQPGDDNKMLVCDTCDKGYHTFCLKPVMTTIPKNGWKCKNCRVCGDCGARTPGNGPSSRWHLNYSVCDSCYQQRNKGLSCPMCGRAYRQLTQKTMAQCRLCSRYVHKDCDTTIEPDQLERECKQPKDYTCPPCRNRDPSEIVPITTEVPNPELDGLAETEAGLVEEPSLQNIENFEIFKIKSEETSSQVASGTEEQESAVHSSQESLLGLPEDSISSMDIDLNVLEKGAQQLGQSGIQGSLETKPVGLGIGKPSMGKKPGKKPGRSRGRPPGSLGKKKAAAVNQAQPKPQTYSASVTLQPAPERKRAPKVKIKLGSISGTSSIAQSRWTATDDDDPKATTVVCSMKDDFMLKQDICVNCGSYGSEKEGELIVCVQCGQCYHPYCADVKVSKVILQKGWRCLDCTVCEGCGQPHDEGRLILCDECDVSYHIYCLDPPLDKVPKGTWKCKWCVECYTCGKRQPGFCCSWQNNYSQCGVCASYAKCPVCEMHYHEDDTIIQCESCTRWLHTFCDNLNTEDDAERAADYGYHCLYCRPVTGKHGPLPPEKALSPEPLSPPAQALPPAAQMAALEMPKIPDVPRPPARQFLVDGVCVSDRARGLIQEQAAKFVEVKKRKRRGGGRGGLANLQRLMSGDDDLIEDRDILEEEGIKLGPGDTPPHSLEDSEMLQSPDKESAGLGLFPKKTRARLRIGMGIGGFIARPRGRGVMRSRGLGRAAAGSFGRGAVTGPECLDDKKKGRRMLKKKPTSLEESFPAYLQEAFFGRPILDQSCDTDKFELDESVASDEDAGMFSDSTELKSAIEVKDPFVFQDESAQRTPLSHASSIMSPKMGDIQLPQLASNQPDKQPSTDLVKTDQGDSDKEHPLMEDDLNDFLPNLLTHDGDINDADLMGIFGSDVGTDQQGLDQLQSSQMDDKQLDHMLDANIDVDKQINSDLMSEFDSELAQIDSKTIEDVFKGVMDHQQITSPNTTADGAFQLPPLPSDPLQAQANQHQTHPQPPPYHPPPGISHPSHPPHPSQGMVTHDTHHTPPAGHQPLPHQSPIPHQSPHPHPSPHAVLSGPSSVHSSPQHPMVPPQGEGANPIPSFATSIRDFVHMHSLPADPSAVSAHTSAQSSPLSRSQPPTPQPWQQGPPLATQPPPLATQPPPGMVPGVPKVGSGLQKQKAKAGEEGETEHMSWNKKNILKWEKDEPLGHLATISPVLYANVNFPELKTKYPEWNERAKHIAKIWRRVGAEEKAPYLAQARDNRASSRLEKAQKAKETRQEKRRAKTAAGGTKPAEQGVSQSAANLDRSTPGSQPPTPTGSDTSSVNTPVKEPTQWELAQQTQQKQLQQRAMDPFSQNVELGQGIKQEDLFKTPQLPVSSQMSHPAVSQGQTQGQTLAGLGHGGVVEGAGDLYSQPPATPRTISAEGFSAVGQHAPTPGTPMAQSTDPYSQQPATPMMHSAPYGEQQRGPLSQDVYARAPPTPRTPLTPHPMEEGYGPRTPQEQFGPRFPTPAPRVADPFAGGKPRAHAPPPPHLMQQEQYARTPVSMGARPPGSDVHFRPMAAGERFAHPAQQPPTPAVSTGSDVTSEIQRLLAQRQYMIEQSQAATMLSPYRQSYFPGGARGVPRALWAQHPSHNRQYYYAQFVGDLGKDDNAHHQQLRELLKNRERQKRRDDLPADEQIPQGEAPQSQSAEGQGQSLPPQLQGQPQGHVGQGQALRWAEGQQFPPRPGFPQFSQEGAQQGYPPGMQMPPRGAPPQGWPRGLRPEMFVRGPHGEMVMRPGYRPDMRGARPPPHAGKPFPGMPFPPRVGYVPQRHPRQPMEMTPQGVAMPPVAMTPAQRQRIPYLQMFQERLRQQKAAPGPDGQAIRMVHAEGGPRMPHPDMARPKLEGGAVRMPLPGVTGEPGVPRMPMAPTARLPTEPGAAAGQVHMPQSEAASKATQLAPTAAPGSTALAAQYCQAPTVTSVTPVPALHVSAHSSLPHLIHTQQATQPAASIAQPGSQPPQLPGAPGSTAVVANSSSGTVASVAARPGVVSASSVPAGVATIGAPAMPATPLPAMPTSVATVSAPLPAVTPSTATASTAPVISVSIATPSPVSTAVATSIATASAALPTIAAHLRTVPVPSVSVPLPTMSAPLPSMSVQLPSLSLPLPTATVALPTLSSALPGLSRQVSSTASSPALSVPLPSVTASMNTPLTTVSSLSSTATSLPVPTASTTQGAAANSPSSKSAPLSVIAASLPAPSSSMSSLPVLSGAKAVLNERASTNPSVLPTSASTDTQSCTNPVVVANQPVPVDNAPVATSAQGPCDTPNQGQATPTAGETSGTKPEGDAPVSAVDTSAALAAPAPGVNRQTSVEETVSETGTAVERREPLSVAETDGTETTQNMPFSNSEVDSAAMETDTSANSENVCSLSDEETPCKGSEDKEEKNSGEESGLPPASQTDGCCDSCLLIPVSAQIDGCHDNISSGESVEELSCDFEVEQIFDLTLNNCEEEISPDEKCATWLANYTSPGSSYAIQLSPIALQVDGLGDEQKGQQPQLQGHMQGHGQSPSPGAAGHPLQGHAYQQMAHGPGSHGPSSHGPGSVGSGSMPASPAMMMKTPPGTPRTPKTPPGSKSPTRGGGHQHPLSQAAQMQQFVGHPQFPHGIPPQAMIQGQRPTTPTQLQGIRSPVPGMMMGQPPHPLAGHPARPGAAPQIPPGPTMGNPPPPYPVQQPSGKSPKASQSPRPSPKPSPLHPLGPSPSQPVPSPHPHVASPHGTVASVGSPHGIQSPHPGSRSDTPQMSPRGPHTPSGSGASGSQPGTPQGGHPGLPGQLPHMGAPSVNLPTSLPAGHMIQHPVGQGSVMRMTSQPASGTLPTTQAAMAQLASMAQSMRGPAPAANAMGPRPSSLSGMRGPFPPHGVPGGPQPIPSTQSVPVSSSAANPSAIAAMLSQQHAAGGRMMMPGGQVMYRGMAMHPQQQHMYMMGQHRAQFGQQPPGGVQQAHAMQHLPPGHPGLRQPAINPGLMQHQPPSTHSQAAPGMPPQPASAHAHPPPVLRPGAPATQQFIGREQAVAGQRLPHTTPMQFQQAQSSAALPHAAQAAISTVSGQQFLQQNGVAVTQAQGSQPTVRTLPGGQVPQPVTLPVSAQAATHAMAASLAATLVQVSAPNSQVTAVASAQQQRGVSAANSAPVVVSISQVPPTGDAAATQAFHTNGQAPNVVTVPQIRMQGGSVSMSAQGHTSQALPQISMPAPQVAQGAMPQAVSGVPVSMQQAAGQTVTSQSLPPQGVTSQAMAAVRPTGVPGSAGQVTMPQPGQIANLAQSSQGPLTGQQPGLEQYPPGAMGNRAPAMRMYPPNITQHIRAMQQLQQMQNQAMQQRGVTPPQAVVRGQGAPSHSGAMPQGVVPPAAPSHGVPQTSHSIHPPTAPTLAQGQPQGAGAMPQGPVSVQGAAGAHTLPPPHSVATSQGAPPQGGPPHVAMTQGGPPQSAAPPHSAAMTHAQAVSTAAQMIQQSGIQMSKERLLLLKEQPLLLEDLLEEEKQEQMKRQQEEQTKGGQGQMTGAGQHPGMIISETDMQMKAGMMGERPPAPHPGMPHMGQPQRLQMPSADGWPRQMGVPPPPFGPRGPQPQMSPRTPSPYPAGQGMFPGAPSPAIQSPPPPPQMPTKPALREPITEEEKRQHVQYDQWLNSYNHWLGAQLKEVEAKVAQYRKTKKSLGAKQRNAKKNGTNLSETDQATLASATEELPPVMKQLDSLRKQTKSHSNLTQEYRSKMQEFLAPPQPPWQHGQAPPPGIMGPPHGPPPAPPPHGAVPPSQPHVTMPQPPALVGGPVPPPGMPQPHMSQHPPQGIPPQSAAATTAGVGAPGAMLQPRMPGNQPMRLPAQVRQEYEQQMLHRIKMTQHGQAALPQGHIQQQQQPGQLPSQQPGQGAAQAQPKMTIVQGQDHFESEQLKQYLLSIIRQQDENNPFSDTYQQRETADTRKQKQQEAQKLLIQQTIEQQQRAIQEEAAAKQPPPYNQDGAGASHFPGDGAGLRLPAPGVGGVHPAVRMAAPESAPRVPGTPAATSLPPGQPAFPAGFVPGDSRNVDQGMRPVFPQAGQEHPATPTAVPEVAPGIVPGALPGVANPANQIKEGGASQTSTPPSGEAKPKKKRKRKKKSDMQAEAAAAAAMTAATTPSHNPMQLPLDLDLQPMRMPSLPQFPDLNLGATSHGSLAQPLHSTPQGTPGAAAASMLRPPYMLPGMARGEPGMMRPEGGLMVHQPQKDGMSELEKLVNMQPQVMSPDVMKSQQQVAASLNAIQQRLQKHGGVPMSQPLPPQVSMAGDISPEKDALERLKSHSPKSQLSPTSHNVLLKQLLASSKMAAQAAGIPYVESGRPPSRSVSETTEDADESVMNLTPEQQKQLAMIEKMPLIVEKETSLDEWSEKSREERERIIAAKTQEMELTKYAAQRGEDSLNSPPPLQPFPPSGGPTPQLGPDGLPIKVKKKRKKKDLKKDGASLDGMSEKTDKPAKKRARKNSTAVAMPAPAPLSLKEEPQPDLSAIFDQIMLRVKSLPRMPLTEPEVKINFGSLGDEKELFGLFGHASLDDVADIYSTEPFPSKPLPDIFEHRKRKLYAKHACPITAAPWLDQDGKMSKLVGQKPALPAKPQMPTPPLILPRTDALSRASDKSPSTIVDTSSPETGFEAKPQYPGLRLISHEEGKTDEEKARECASPEIPVVCPVPLKPIAIKQEVDEEKLPSSTTTNIDKDIGDDSSHLDNDDHDLQDKVTDMHSELGRQLKDPNQMSVTLTLNPNSAENIGGVIAAIADLLKIAVPPTYEVSRSPTPPTPQPASSAQLFSTVAGTQKYKEENINIQALVKAKPKFCRHCEMVVLDGGFHKKKSEIAFLSQERFDFLDYGDEDIVFCGDVCFSFFDAAQKNSAIRASKKLYPEIPIVQENKTQSEVVVPSSKTAFKSPATVMAGGGDGEQTDVKTALPPIGFFAAEAQRREREKENDKHNLRRRSSTSVEHKVLVKKWKGTRYKKWEIHMGQFEQLYKAPTENELHDMINSLAITMRPKKSVRDTRACALCAMTGDLEADGPGRLLIMDVDKYIHLNCALWSNEVYETVSGALMNVENAVKRGNNHECAHCAKRGATLGCFKPRCVNNYHLLCAKNHPNVLFFQDKTVLCALHSPKMGGDYEGEMKNLSVYRKVYINREENRQVASVIHLEEKRHVVRIGSLILQNIGQLLPQQIQTGRFNTRDFVFPVGFKSTRYYWSYRRVNKRCKYVCRINDLDGWPEFTITVIEEGYDKVTHRDASATGVWLKVLVTLDRMRRDNDMVKMFPSYLCGEVLFGLAEPSVLRVIESLPGVELMSNYHFKFGRSSLYKMPVTINPTGCARSEPRLRTYFRKPHTLHTAGHTRTLPQTVAVQYDYNIPYSKQFVHSKSQQYRRLKTEWRNNVYLRRSNVQGLGLFAARDLEKHTMVIEYIGELIRNELAEKREKVYEQQHRGIYMFRIDDNTVVDATMAGGPARYINHSCFPNCVAENVQFERDSKIIIITKRKINRGEELFYDYKFDFEDEQHKIPCLCGAPNCRKWMN